MSRSVALTRGHTLQRFAEHQPTAPSSDYYPDSRSRNVAQATLTPQRHALRQLTGSPGSGYSYHDFSSSNNSPARANSPQRHQPTAFSGGYSNHQDYVSRNADLARGYLPHGHKLQQPTTSANGLANSDYGDEHSPDDGDYEKLAPFCNSILLEFYDSVNAKVSHTRNAFSSSVMSVRTYSLGRQLGPARQTFCHMAASDWLCVSNSESETGRRKRFANATPSNCLSCESALMCPIYNLQSFD